MKYRVSDSQRPDAARPSATRLGAFMLFGAWAVLLALLVLFFGGVLERQDNPNPAPRLTPSAAGAMQVVLSRNRSGHFVANGRINGRQVVFIVDTGATRVALSRSLAVALDLDLRPGGLSQTANGTVRVATTVLDRVELGGLTRRQVAASVLPNMPGDMVLLGMNFLRHFELIQRGETLTLRPVVR